MEQMQLGFSYSTPKAVSDRIKKLGKSLLSALQLISYSQVGPPKVSGQVISTLFIFKIYIKQ